MANLDPAQQPAPTSELLQTQVIELRSLVDQLKAETGKDNPAAIAALAKAEEALASGTATQSRLEALEKNLAAQSAKLEKALEEEAPVTPVVKEVIVSGSPPAAPAPSAPPVNRGLNWG